MPVTCQVCGAARDPVDERCPACGLPVSGPLSISDRLLVLRRSFVGRTSLVLLLWAVALMIVAPLGRWKDLPAFPSGNYAIVLVMAVFANETDPNGLGMWLSWIPYAVLTAGAILHRRRFFIWLGILAVMLAFSDAGCWMQAGSFNLH